MSTASKDRRKSDRASSIITLNVSGSKLRAIFGSKTMSGNTSFTSAAGASTPSVVKDEDSSSAAKDSPAPSANAAALSALPFNDAASDATPNTPGSSGQQDGTPAPSTMAPPTSSGDGAAPKKKGVKRSAAAAGVDANGTANGTNGTNGTNGDSAPKARSKPGPKKKPRVDDGLLDPGRNVGAHKLGPKASMGAINAGLRALDRSGKPCRKWNKGGFQLKTFTGVVWEIPRWTAPPKPVVDDASADASTTATESATGSTKENGSDGKDSKLKQAPVKAGETSESAEAEAKDSTADGDVEMQSAPSAQPSPPPVAAPTSAMPVAVA